MQDKEFDDIFRSKLDGFEAEPSAHVWQNITAELDGKKHKKSTVFILSIAASIVVLITAGILFIPKKGVVKHGRPDTNQLAVNKVKPAVVKSVETTVTTNPAVNKKEQVAYAHQTVKRIIKVRHVEVTKTTTEPKEQSVPIIASQQPERQESKLVLASAEIKNTDDITKPSTDLKVTTIIPDRPETATAPDMQIKPALTATQQTAANSAKPSVKKHGIRNISDLLNLVANKADKNKDKLKRFTDADDDESVISILHIGAGRAKKDN